MKMYLKFICNPVSPIGSLGSLKGLERCQAAAYDFFDRRGQIFQKPFLQNFNTILI